MTETDKLSKTTASIPSMSKELTTCFLNHLNRVYCVKYHLIERLPELADQTYFKDMRVAILRISDDSLLQIQQIDEIFDLLGAEPSIERYDTIISLIEDAFAEINFSPSDPVLRDLSIQYYLSNIENLETVSFRILKKLAVKLGNQQILDLIQVNIDKSTVIYSTFSLPN